MYLPSAYDLLIAIARSKFSSSYYFTVFLLLFLFDLFYGITSSED